MQTTILRTWMVMWLAVSGLSAQEIFDWNRTDKYVAPDYESYFPQGDKVAAEQLENFLKDGSLRANQPDEFIDTVRKGLRSTERPKTLVLSTVGKEFIWNREPQHPQAIELMYHASDAPADVGHYGMYFGPTVVTDRSDNLMRMFIVNYSTFDTDIQRRLHWTFRTHGDKEKTAKQLASLLDEHETLSETSTIAACEYYTKLTGKEPPGMERFESLGKWVIGFSHEDIFAHQEDGFRELRDMLGQHLDIKGNKVLDFIPRIEGEKWVGVMLTKGITQKNQIVSTLNGEAGFQLVFAEQLGPRLFRGKRVNELRKHFVGEVALKLPGYTLPDPEEEFAWNNTEKFVAPNFNNYFPDDPLAGKELDSIYKNRDALNMTDRELLEAFRAGLRHSTVRKNVLFGFLRSALGWPVDPMQREIEYQAAALDAPRDIQYNAIYFGLGNGWDKSDNVLEHFADVLCQPASRKQVANMHGRITWSLLGRENEINKLINFLDANLKDHKNIDDSTLMRVVGQYKNLAKELPPNIAEYENRGGFVVIWGDRGGKQELVDFIRDTELPGKGDLEKGSYSVIEESSEATGLGFVRGYPSFQSLLKTLNSSKSNSVQFAEVWPGEWDQDELPTLDDFRKLMETKRGR